MLATSQLPQSRLDCLPCRGARAATGKGPRSWRQCGSGQPMIMGLDSSSRGPFRPNRHHRARLSDVTPPRSMIVRTLSGCDRTTGRRAWPDHRRPGPTVTYSAEGSPIALQQPQEPPITQQSTWSGAPDRPWPGGPPEYGGSRRAHGRRGCGSDGRDHDGVVVAQAQARESSINRAAWRGDPGAAAGVRVWGNGDGREVDPSTEGANKDPTTARLGAGHRLGGRHACTTVARSRSDRPGARRPCRGRIQRSTTSRA